MATKIETYAGDRWQRALERGIAEGLWAREVYAYGGEKWDVTSNRFPDRCYEVLVTPDGVAHTDASRCDARGLCDHVALVAWRCGRLERLQQVMELDGAERREERDTSVLVAAGPRGRSSLYGGVR